MALTSTLKLYAGSSSALPGLAGRRRVAALKDIAVLSADIRKEFETFWSFGGSDMNLKMPGMQRSAPHVLRP